MNMVVLCAKAVFGATAIRNGISVEEFRINLMKLGFCKDLKEGVKW